MGESGSTLRRAGWVAAGVAVLTAIVAVVVWRVWDGEAVAGFSGVVSMVAAVVAIGLSRTGSSPPQPTLSDVADRIALAVGRQWADEAELRLLNDPYPLPVRWGPADPDLVESWPSLHRLVRTGAGWPPPPPATRWAASPAELAGADNELIDVLERVPTGRLVVLGEPGAGKTVLLVRLVLDLLARRHPGEPVPVLVSLASWNPAEQDLRGWLEARLAIDHPGLVEPSPDGTGRSRARELLEEGLIFPVLDGLDEIPEAHRGRAIARVNDALRPGQHLVLASRVGDYRAAVWPTGGTEVRLTGAAAVELRPLEPGVVANYLRDSAGGPVGASRWDPVLATLAAPSPPPVAQTLTTPLMAGLARVIYNPRPHEHLTAVPRHPDELLDATRFPTREQVEQHLFDAFVPAAYRPHPDPARRCRWSVEQAERWLVHLARELEHRRGGATDLAWWELRDAAPRPLPGLAVGVAAGLAGVVGFVSFLWIGFGLGIFAGITAGLAVRRWAGASGSFARGAAGGLVGGLAALVPQLLFGFDPGRFGDSLAGALALGLAVAPLGGFWAGLTGGLTACLVGLSVASHDGGLVAWLLNGAGLGLAAGLAAGLKKRYEPARGLRWSSLGCTCGTAAGLALGYATFLGYGPTTGLAVGLVATVGGGLAGGFVAEAAIADLTAAAGPDMVLKRDRGTFTTTALAAGLAFGVSNGLGYGIAEGYLDGLGLGFANTVAVALAVGFLQACWGPFVLAKWWLAMRRRLPWQLMRFLADAHKGRGVLRQVGAVYQFRHAELQRRLANRP